MDFEKLMENYNKGFEDGRRSGYAEGKADGLKEAVKILKEVYGFNDD